MFNRKQSKPKVWLDALLPVKDEPKHRLRKGLIGLGIGSAIVAAVTRKRSEQ